VIAGAARPSGQWGWIVCAGFIVGLVYTLSPLLVCFAIGMALVWRWASAGLPAEERRAVLALLAAAVVLRLVIVAGLFAFTNHATQPFGSLFGDEEYFIKRSLWMRSVALRIPLSAADFIYAYDSYSETSHLYVLTLIQILFGPSPYGAHLVGMLLYLAGAVMLFRTVRRSFGVTASLLGLLLLLFLPSLFAWSISALKEPLFFFVTSGVLALAVAAVRSPLWRWRIGAVGLLGAAALVAGTIRQGGMVIVAVGTLAGWGIAWALMRPRLAAAGLILMVAAAPIVLTRGRVQDQVAVGVRRAALAHWGHVNTAGYVYTVLDGRFYRDRSSIRSMTLREGARFVTSAIVSYVTVPTPWQLKSRSALSFLPEQIVWYGLVLLAPIGLLVGLRRDVLVSSLLLAHTLVAAGLVALTSGNVGTLVRHRGLAVPFLIWFSALGACELAARWSAPPSGHDATERAAR